MYAVRFTWTAEKERANRQKHGISFGTAREVFDDQNHVVLENYFVQQQGEQRYQIIGMTRALVLLLVVFLDRSAGETEIIHIISARKTNDYEETIYSEASAR